MAIASRDQLVAALDARRVYPYTKQSPAGGAVSTAVPNMMVSYFFGNGQPGASAATGNSTCSSATSGAIRVPAPAAGNTWYLCGFTLWRYSANMAGPMYLLDRLAHATGLSATASTQAVGVGMPARVTGKSVAQIWLEVAAAGGASAIATVTASYTNQDGTAGRTATMPGGLPASTQPGRMFGFDLQAGDTGVSSVESVTFGSSSGAAGAMTVVLARQLAVLSTGFQSFGAADQVTAPETLIDVGADPCLMLASHMGTFGAVPYERGEISLCQG